MRVLIVSMAAMAETAGSFSRMVLLANALKEANIDTAVCLAKDVNYRPIDGVKSYFLSTPMPLGLPKMMAKHTFPIAQKIGITSRKSVNSFDDVLHLTGNTDYRYLKISPGISKNKNKILVYMGNGTISQKKMVKEIFAAFKNSGFSVYIAGRGLKRQHFDNIQTAPYFYFQKLLSQSALYINHGGQNSVIDGLINGVPQLICAGKVFERKYNAGSIVKIGAGLEIPYKEFTGCNIKAVADKIISQGEYQKNAMKTDKVLLSLGGAGNIIKSLEEFD